LVAMPSKRSVPVPSRAVGSYGQRPGPLAHDLNNVLAVILSAAKLALGADHPDDARDDIDTIIEAVAHASRITTRLSALDRRRAASDEPIQLDRLIEELESVLRGAVSNHATIELDLARDGATFIGNRTQVEQLLLNL